jgi:hypothetical protein
VPVGWYVEVYLACLAAPFVDDTYHILMSIATSRRLSMYVPATYTDAPLHHTCLHARCIFLGFLILVTFFIWHHSF